MKLFSAVSLVFLVTAPALADGWTCSALCGYADGDRRIVALQPQTIVWGEGTTPRKAWDEAMTECARKVPAEKPTRLVRGFAEHPDKSELAMMNTHCVKN